VAFAVALFAAAPLLGQAPNSPAAGSAKLSLPSNIASWEQQTDVSTWQPRVRTANVSPTQATYSYGDRYIQVFVAQATNHRDKISGGAVDLVGDENWMPAAQRRISACARTRCQDILYTKHLLRDTKRARHIYTAYALNGAIMASSFSLRFRRAWMALRGTEKYARLVAIATEGTVGLSPREAALLIEAIAVAPLSQVAEGR
jgi:hypothetical protein